MPVILERVKQSDLRRCDTIAAAASDTPLTGTSATTELPNA
jgi:hypothetical protein